MAMAQSSEVYPGEGMIFIQVMSDPAKVSAVIDGCLGVADSLSKDGVTQEELDRLREPVLAQLRDAVRRNGYWATCIAESQTRPESLDDVRSIVAHYKELKAEDLTALAKQYLERIARPFSSSRRNRRAGARVADFVGRRLFELR